MIRIIAVFLLLVLGCNNENPAAAGKRISSTLTFSAPVAGLTETDSSVSVENPPPEPEVPIELWGNVVFIDSLDGELPTDPFDLNAGGIAGDTLAVEVSYSGGCADHELILVAADSLETDSIRLNVELAHNANSDPCEAWLTEEHLSDLAPIRNRFGIESSGGIALQLEGAGELLYTFAVAIQ